ncbi:MAG: LysR family transcriptional regulator, partial [Pseudonocardiaceae bacterium]
MADTPDVLSLRLLVLVGAMGSMSRAAAEIGVSQPAASKRLSTLERRLGLALVDRSKRGSVLAPAGQLVAGWAQRVLDEVDGLLTGVQVIQAQRDARLRVAASMTVAEHLAPLWIRDLRKSSPALHVGLQVTNSDHVAELTRNGEVDLGFIETPDAPPGLTSCRVATDQLVLVVAPCHPWTRRSGPVRAVELAASQLITREPGSGTRETVDRALLNAGLGTVSQLVELGSNAAVRAAVIAEAGPAVLSELAVTGDLVQGRLVAIDTDGIDLRRNLRAIWRRGRRLVGPPRRYWRLPGRSTSSPVPPASRRRRSRSAAGTASKRRQARIDTHAMDKSDSDCRTTVAALTRYRTHVRYRGCPGSHTAHGPGAFGLPSSYRTVMTASTNKESAADAFPCSACPAQDSN